jgi:hypothetical protein
MPIRTRRASSRPKSALKFFSDFSVHANAATLRTRVGLLVFGSND